MISSPHRCVVCEKHAMEEISADTSQICMKDGVYYCSKHFLSKYFLEEMLRNESPNE